MKKITFFIILTLAASFMFAGTSCNFAQNSASSRQLSGKQKAQAEEWSHSADLLYKVGDYDFSLEYYKKIVTYYPGTKYSKKAQERIDEINKLQKN
jgi:outer membrane protein assembly factor BamD (BamD/ComL family)